MYFRLRAALLALSILLPTVADAADYPKPNEGNFALRDFKFASGETLPIPGGHKLYRFAACPNYNPGSDASYPDLRPRDSYRFVSKVLRPSADTFSAHSKQ